jgi:hypothetical protein
MTTDITLLAREALLEKSEIYKHYKNSKYSCQKHAAYFQVYEELLSKYRNKKFTFVEVGIFDGGSLFMWRSYFGPEARIIGIEFNPEAKKWEKDGFEIFIGSQSDPVFWDKFFATVGDIDVLIDDGGHTSEQQIITTYKCIPHIKDGGMLIVEDTHTNYMKEYGNPSKYSFISYAKSLIDSINSRFHCVNVSKNPLKNAIYSMSVYDSIVCFNIDREKCFVSSLPLISNGGIESNPTDFTFNDTYSHQLSACLSIFFKKFGVNFSSRKLFRFVENIFTNRKLKKYFK